MSLQVRELRFGYGKREVLSGVTFRVSLGEVAAVLGPNGAGKSTLFHCVLGFNNRKMSGEVKVCGDDVRTLNASELAKRVAYVPQSHEPTFNYTVQEMVLMGTTAQVGGLGSPGKRQTEQAAEAMERVGISALASRGYLHLSGGERQLTLVARALAQQAKLLVMDEPTANLDYGNQIRVMTRIKELASTGIAVLISTHNPEHARRFATRVIALQNGVAAADGSPAELVTDELICSLYGLTPEQLTINN